MRSLAALFVCLAFPPLIQSYITYIEVKYPLPGTPSPPGTPWPLPAHWSPSETVLTLDPQRFTITNPGGECEILPRAIGRYQERTFPDVGSADPGLPLLSVLDVTVEKPDCGYPAFGDDESYTLTVPENPRMQHAELRAVSVWGALRGLETFSQLVYQDEDHQYYINATTIRDRPRYSHRGLLLDTSRHFLPKSILKDNLDAMEMNKFNVFHWHIVDDQSWPFESKIYPNLTKAAYSPKHVYTQEDVQEIIDYARLRGIRVIPEFDTPGHTQAVGKIFPELLTPCYGTAGKPYTPDYPNHAAAEILNPTLNATYDFFVRLFEEVNELFADEYIHLGMDEVYYDCWKSNPHIKAFMDKMGLETYNDLENYYVSRTLENVKTLGYKYIIWQDPIDNDVKAANDTIVQVWKDKELVSTWRPWQEYIAPIARKGYKLILSSCWYLNYISYGQDWKKYYECDPRDFPGTEYERNLVVGGEACMWGEYVDGTNILPRLWPRASAVAERLWSPAESTNDTDSAAFRLDQHRCRMLRRGIPAAPILNGYCGDYEWAMNSGAGPATTSTLPPSTSTVVALLPLLLTSATPLTPCWNWS